MESEKNTETTPRDYGYQFDSWEEMDNYCDEFEKGLE